MLNVVAPLGLYLSNLSRDTTPHDFATRDITTLLVILARLGKERCTVVASESECEASAIGHLSSIMAPECVVLPLPLPTAGPVFSILMSLADAPMEKELLILEPGLPGNAPLQETIARSRESGCDGCIAIHGELATDLPCAVEDQSGVSHVAWNRPAAGRRLAGFHWFRRTRFFVEAAEKAVLRHATETGTLELGAAWNEALLSGMRVGLTEIDSHHGRTSNPMRTMEAVSPMHPEPSGR